MTVKAQLSSLGEAAIDYARRGWPVFPCAPGLKVPWVSHGVYAATTDEDLITEWWSREPMCNIGYPTGEIYVIDADGSTGADSISLIAAMNEWPDTRTVHTPHGTHYWFRAYEELPNSASKIGEKIDSRGYGGYVCLPPSINAETGAVYTWANDLPVADLPEWLAVELRPKRWNPQTAPSSPDEFVLYDSGQKYDPGTGSWRLGDAGPLHPYVGSFLPDKWNDLARLPEGNRNASLNELAFLCGRIARAGYGDPTYMEDHVKQAARSCGLADKEISATWRSGYESGWGSEPFNIKEKPFSPNSKHQQMYRKSRSRAQLAKDFNLVITPLSKVEKKNFEFIWGDRLVKNAVNLVAGDGGIGKSAVMLHLVASVTDGIPLPDSKGQTLRGQVMIVSYEDPAHVIEQRATVIGVHPDKLFVIEGAREADEEDEERIIQFSQDQVPALDQALETYPDVRLLIIDPWARYLDGEDNQDSLIRRAAAPLEDLVRRHNLTVVLVCHTNKNSSYTEAVHRIAGHSALKNLSRSVLMLSTVEGETKAIVHAKHNWSSQADAVLYKWQEEKSWRNGENPLAFGDVTKIDADELFAPRKAAKVDEAKAWLRRMLADGPMGVTQVRELAKEERIQSTTLDYVFTALGVIQDTSTSRVMWKLPYA